MIRTDRRLRVCAVLIVCTLVFIWGNSLLPGELSSKLSDWVKSLLSWLPLGGHHSGGTGLLRKAAHFTEFMLLGVCLSWLFGMLKKEKIWAFLSGAAAACADETIQLFVAGRHASILDVGIDCCGVLTGIILFYFGYAYRRKRSAKPSLEDKET